MFYKILNKDSFLKDNHLPIVFLSGFGGDHTAWDKIISLIPDAYPLILIDNQGAGLSELRNKKLHAKDMAVDVINILDKENIQKALIVGHSMGGAIAQQMALMSPEKTFGIVLAGSFSKLKPLIKKVLVNRVELSESKISKLIKINNALPWLYSSSYLSIPENVKYAQNRVLKNPTPQTTEGMYAQLNACIEHDTSTQLHQIKTPCLILSAKEDLLIDYTHTEFLQANIKHSKSIIIEDTGHMFIIEKPEIVSQEILRFYHNIRIN